MPVVTLPDGSQRSYDQSLTIADVAADIGPGLAKATLAGKVDDQVVDASYLIDKDVELAIITSKSDEALELIRHDAAHVMAQAVQELYPGTQVTIGPAIEDGFYYDFAREEPFTPADLQKIEDRMREIVGRDLPIEREVWDRAKAMDTFGEIGEKYKVEIIDDIIPEGEEVSVYRQGEWFDVCRGPHLPSTGKLPKAFKLMKLAGAGQMRATAYVEPLALAVDRHLFAFRNDVIDNFDLVLLTDTVESLHCLRTIPDFTLNRQITTDDLAHAVFDLL